MIHPDLVKLYNNVRAEHWPDIESYADILVLPEEYRREIAEADKYSRNHVVTGYNLGYKKGNVIFVPVLKCASTYYRDTFDYLKWERVNIYDYDPEQIHFTGVLMHPLRRRLKGLVQTLYDVYRENLAEQLNNERFCQFVSLVSVTDLHTMPYTNIFGSKLLKKIDFVPMCVGDKNTRMLLNQKFTEYGLSDKIDNDTMLNQSGMLKKQSYEKLKKIFYDQTGDFYKYLYVDDIAYYHRLLEKYQNFL